MRVAVCVDPILTVETGVRLDRDRCSADAIDPVYAANPSDDSSVAAALDLGSAHTVGVFAFAPERADPFLRDYLAAGVAEVMRVWDPGMAHMDDLERARIVATTVSQWSADIVMCGDRIGEKGVRVLGPMVAELLGVPQVTAAVRVTVADDQITAQRRVDGFVETVRTRIPAVVTLGRGRPLPYPTLPRRIRARSVSIEERKPVEFGIDIGDLDRLPLEVVAVSTPKPRRKTLPDPRSAIDRTISMLLGGGGSDTNGTILDGYASSTADEVADRCMQVLETM